MTIRDVLSGMVNDGWKLVGKLPVDKQDALKGAVGVLENAADSFENPDVEDPDFQ